MQIYEIGIILWSNLILKIIDKSNINSFKIDVSSLGKIRQKKALNK